MILIYNIKFDHRSNHVNNMQQFYPIVREIKTNKEYKWELLDELNVGGESAIMYDLRCNKSGSYVLKFMEFENYKPEVYEKVVKQVINEVQIHDSCYSLGISPEIIEAWICDKGAIIIMRKLYKTVRKLLSESKSFLVRYTIVTNVISLIDTMHQNGIYHHDAHPDNFMVVNINQDMNQDMNHNEWERYNSKEYKYYVIDFGASESSKGVKNDHKTAHKTADDYLVFASFMKYYFSIEETKKLLKSFVTLTKKEKKILLKI